MPGLGKQGKRKAEKRLADLGVRPPQDIGYVAPSPDECEEYCYTLHPSGGDMSKERVKIRLVTLIATGGLVAFAVVQQTKVGQRWRDVAVADSSHDDEVHVHRYGRRADGRVGEPEIVKPIMTMDDVEDGYDLAYDVIVEAWEDNKRRWDNA